MPRDSAFEVFFVAAEGAKKGTHKIVVAAPYGPAVVSTKWPNVIKFCFPGSQHLTTEEDTAFTFVLTDEVGYRLYGHTTKSVNGHAYCFLSKYPWCRFFYYATYVFQANNEDIRIIQKLHSAMVPAPSGLFTIPTTDPFAEDFNSYHLQRPNDAEFMFVDTWPHELLELFTFDQLFTIMSAMLTESQMVVVGCNFSVVSRICLSLLALVYPFEWQHVLVPITPSALLDVVSAPTPFLVGVINSQLEYVRKLPTSSTLLYVTVSNDCKKINLGGGALRIPRLPKSGITSTLRRHVQLWYYSPKRVKDRRRQTTPLQSLERQETDLRGLLPIFLRYYGDIFGAIGMERGYDQRYFLNHYATKDTFPFMEAVVTTQLFDTQRLRTEQLMQNGGWKQDPFCRVSISQHSAAYPRLLGEMPQLKKSTLSRVGSFCNKAEDEIELQPRQSFLPQQ